jgi:hypothetical protein
VVVAATCGRGCPAVAVAAAVVPLSNHQKGGGTHLLTLSSVLQLVPYFSWRSAVAVTVALVVLDLSGHPCRPCSHQSRPQVLIVVALVVLSLLSVAFPPRAFAFWSSWSSLGCCCLWWCVVAVSLVVVLLQPATMVPVDN